MKKVNEYKTLHDFLCPISKEIMFDPQIISDGNTYENILIKTWIKKKKVSPLFGSPLTTETTYPNKVIFTLIQRFRNLECSYKYLCNVKQNVKKESQSFNLMNNKYYQQAIAKLEEHKSVYFKGDCDNKEWELSLLSSVKEYSSSPSIIFSIIDYYTRENEYGKAKTWLKVLNQVTNGCPAAYFPLVKINMSKGKKNKGIEIFEKLISQNILPEYTELDLRTYICSWLFSHSYYTVEATRIVNGFTRLCPQKAWFLSAKICINYSLKKYEETIEMITQYLDNFGKNGVVLFKKGQVYGRLKQYDSAIQAYHDYNNLIKFPRLKAEAFYEIGLCKYKASRNDFEEEFKVAHEIDPETNSDLILTAIYSDLLNYEKAEPWAEVYYKRCEKSKTNVFFLEMLAEIKEKVNKNQEAIGLYLSLGKINKENSNIYAQKINQLLDTNKS